MSGASHSLVVLTDRYDDFWEARPLVKLMLPLWQEMGVRVSVVTDADRFVPADAALLHVDLTVVPDFCRRLAQRYPLVLNGGALDIRKRRISRALVGRDDSYRGPVIVKTDMNHGGWREFRRRVRGSLTGSALRRMRLHNRVCRTLARREAGRPWRTRRLISTGQYPVFAHRSEVPEGVWENPHMVVERFAVEREGENYCCRHWLFFGAEEVHRRTISAEPVIKADSVLETLPEPIPEELRALRAELGFDYGKFDYGMIEGRVVLYDANRTPGTAADPSRHAATVAKLSKGLLGLFARKP